MTSVQKGIERRSDFSDASVEPTDACNAAELSVTLLRLVALLERAGSGR